MTMRKNPTVSVIIPTYNRANLIEKAIRNVLNQTYQDFEIIVIDDGSTDNTREIIRSFNDKRVKYIKKYKKNKGISVARNVGIKMARGKYFALLDSDDEWLPEKLDKQIKILQDGSSELGVVYSNLCYIDENGKNMNKLRNPKKEGYIYEDLLGENYVGPPSTLLIRKECFHKVGLFDNLLNAMEDWDMWIRIAKYYRFSLIKIPLVKYRLHSNQLSINLRVKNIAANRILVKYANELEIRRGAHSKHYFYMGNRFCHMEKTKEGQRYLLKAISLCPFYIRYYISMFGSLFGPKCFIYFVNIKRCLTMIIMKHIGKIRKINLNSL
jgi:glycosyltransferase involved in cell wall biosynthesis